MKKVLTIKQETDRLDFIKIKNFYLTEDTFAPFAIPILVPVVEMADSEPLKSCSFIKAMRALAKK